MIWFNYLKKRAVNLKFQVPDSDLAHFFRDLSQNEKHFEIKQPFQSTYYKIKSKGEAGGGYALEMNEFSSTSPVHL